ncbi:MAG TPA: F0F1 ATP synthase subunit epsilon [Candidatus Paceibacterota bacterium]|nr:F0F1 ATP synthase subunit epsilon [Candidatus Paceibacterota bacterium]
MQLGVYALEKVLYHGEAASINCRTKIGEITILDHHRPLISILDRGVMTIVDPNGKEHYIPVSSGFLEVNSRNQAKILVEEEIAS